MSSTFWFIAFGAVFTVMGLSSAVIKRLPLTTALLYLAIGFVMGPQVGNVFFWDTLKNAEALERLTEIVVIISLFAAGLKLRLPWNDPKWILALRLAFVSMVITVFLITLIGVYVLKLPLGAAILLGAILAPTDPVLASDVQVTSPEDQDRLRFSLTGEAGLNDGTAFPFVMLGLGLLGLHDIGSYGWKWILIDVLWAIPGGLAIGAAMGTALAQLVIYLRKKKKETALLDDFLALGLISLSYGIAVLFKTYGFLAVFSAGLALRRIERIMSGQKLPPDITNSPEKAPAYTAQAVLLFNEQLERLGEVAMVLLLGTMISLNYFSLNQLWFTPVLFLAIRPASVMIGLWKSAMPEPQTHLIAWFGIRGIGSLYYLFYAIERGLDESLATKLISITLMIVSISIVLHGISVTPLMNLYIRRSNRKLNVRQ